MCKLFNKPTKKSSQAQSTVEYIVLITAVISVAILFLTRPNAGFQQKLYNTLDSTSNQMQSMSQRLFNGM